jgi:hypothetical protein
LLGNADQLNYYRRTILDDMGLVPGKGGADAGDKFITDMFAWNK